MTGRCRVTGPAASLGQAPTHPRKMQIREPGSLVPGCGHCESSALRSPLVRVSSGCLPQTLWWWGRPVRPWLASENAHARGPPEAQSLPSSHDQTWGAVLQCHHPHQNQGLQSVTVAAFCMLTSLLLRVLSPWPRGMGRPGCSGCFFGFQRRNAAHGQRLEPTGRQSACWRGNAYGRHRSVNSYSGKQCMLTAPTSITINQYK